ncbi:MAG: sulfotransferase [Acidimicrobiales bacterium]
MRLQVGRAVRRTVARPLSELRVRGPRLLGGWEVGPPDFIGVGVQRSGTSWWHRVLDHHPDVHDRGPFSKELHFFDDYWRRPFDAADAAAYQCKFARPRGMRSGEWTPRYLADPWTPPLIRHAAPGARLLVMLRDPVSRMRSGVTHAAERGRKIDETVVATAIARGFYHQQLTHLLQSFPREQVLVLQMEKCIADPGSMLERTLLFLGLRTDVSLSAALTNEVNTRRGEPVKLSAKFLDAVRAGYEPDVTRLAGDFSEIDLGLWPHFAELA